MKLAFLNPAAQLGGAERSLLDILASLRAAEPGWSLHLITTGGGPLIDRAEMLGVPTTVVPIPPGLAQLGDGGASGAGLGRIALIRALPNAARYASRLREVLRDLRADLVHSNGFKMHVLGAWTVGGATPLVWHVHDFVGRRPVMSGLLRMHAHRCSAVVANSRSVAGDVERVCGKRLPVHTVYNGVDLDAFSPRGPKLDLDRSSGLPPAVAGTLRLGLVATLGWWKGHETFLRAAALLPHELPWRAYVVGGPLYETAGSQGSVAELRDMARRLGIGERVGFTGFTDDSAAAMRALDVVVHASTEPEPFGLVIVEAMACGRAVVVSRAGGAAELFTPGVDALGHAPSDVQGLAAQIESLLRDPELRERLGRAGRETAERRFDRSRLAAELAPIYRELTRSRDR